MDVRDRGRSLRALVQSAVDDRDVVAAVDEPLNERDAGRSGPADHERARHGAHAIQGRTPATGTPGARVPATETTPRCGEPGSWCRRRRAHPRSRRRKAARWESPSRAATSYSRPRSVSNIAGSSVLIEHSTPAASIAGNGWLSMTSDRTRAQVRDRAHVADDAARRDLGEQCGIVTSHGCRAVADRRRARRSRRGWTRRLRSHPRAAPNRGPRRARS